MQFILNINLKSNGSILFCLPLASSSVKNVKSEGVQGRSPAHPAMGRNFGSDAKNNLVALLLLSSVAWRLLGLGNEPSRATEGSDLDAHRG